MSLLLASLAALAVGPLLVQLAGGRAWAHGVIDAFVVVAIGGLVLLDIIPDSVQQVGWPALLAAGVGLLAPSVVHGPLDDCARRSARPLMAAAGVALALHAFVDGIGLVPQADHDQALAWAVVLHRVLEGLAIWWLVRPHVGAPATALLVALIGLATWAGTGLGALALAQGLATPILLSQAAVAGSLLHVLLRHAPAASARAPAWASGAAGLLACGALAAIAAPAPHAPGSGAATFAALAAGAAAPLLVGLALVALAHAALPAPQLRLPDGGGPLRQACRGAWYGLCETMCSCGVIPLYRATAQACGTAAAALAYLACAPALGLPALALCVAYFGPLLTAACGVATVATAVVAALGSSAVAARTGAAHEGPAAQAHLAAQGHAAAGGHAATHDHAAAPGHAATHSHVAAHGHAATHSHVAAHDHAASPSIGRGGAPGLADGLHFALGEVLDHTAPWVLLGLALAALVLTCVPAAWAWVLRARGIEVPLLAALGLPFYLSAPAATLLAVALLAKGVSAGAAVGFMVTSSAVGLGAAAYLARARGRAVAATFCALIWAGASAAGAAINLCGLRPATPRLLTAPGWVAALAALFAAALLRQGVRPFLEQVAVPNTAAEGSAHHHPH